MANTGLEALNGPSRRAKIHDATIVFKVPATVKELVSTTAKEEGVADAQVVRWALAEYFERRGIN